MKTISQPKCPAETSPLFSTVRESTLAERKAYLESGAEEITPAELGARLAALGYSIETASSFLYMNTLNVRPYLAFSLFIIHTESGKSFANVTAPQHNLPALQALRRNTFVFNRAHIWEY